MRSFFLVKNSCFFQLSSFCSDIISSFSLYQRWCLVSYIISPAFLVSKVILALFPSSRRSEWWWKQPTARKKQTKKNKIISSSSCFLRPAILYLLLWKFSLCLSSRPDAICWFPVMADAEYELFKCTKITKLVCGKIPFGLKSQPPSFLLSWVWWKDFSGWPDLGIGRREKHMKQQTEK